MSMEQVHTIMKETGVGFLATTDGEKVGVRPVVVKWVDGELWTSTFAGSDKAAQIKARPSVEYCFADKQWRHVRISGTCTISTDNADREKFFGMMPELKKYFSGPDDPNYVVLRTKVDRIRLIGPEEMQYTEVTPPGK